MNKDKRIYFHKSTSYNWLLEVIQSGDLQFYYKGHAYNITFHGKNCIVCIDDVEDNEELWNRTIRFFDSEEELLNNYVFEDGVPLLEALKDESIDLY